MHFEKVENVKVESVEMDQSQVYISPETKRQNQYKFYNNTRLYVTFRKEFLQEPLPDEPQSKADKRAKLKVKTLYNSVIIDELEKKEGSEELREEFKTKDLSVKKIETDHIVVSLKDLMDLKRVAKVLSKRKEVLAIEYLDKKRVFGEKAALREMSGFKSKVKKQTPVYDPEVEREKEAQRKKEEAMLQGKDSVEIVEEPEEEVTFEHPHPDEELLFREPSPYMPEL